MTNKKTTTKLKQRIMTTNDRINAIVNKRRELDEKEMARNNVIEKRNLAAIANIKRFADDFKELISLANALQENGFTLGKIDGHNCAEFISNGITHRVGFYTRENPFYKRSCKISGFGIVNGGVDGRVDLVIDLDGNILLEGQVFPDGRKNSILRFAREFEDFKRDFLAYVDSVIK